MGQKILVVEDNELNLKLFCDLLRAHGYEAEPVRDGREAVARARAFAPDLVVMDIQMPYVSGLELIEQMKADEELRATPIMAVTAYAAKGDEERIRDAGAEGYVSKPISVLKFVEAVAGLLEASADKAAQAQPALTAAEGGSPDASDIVTETGGSPVEAALEGASDVEPDGETGPRAIPDDGPEASGNGVGHEADVPPQPAAAEAIEEGDSTETLEETPQAGSEEEEKDDPDDRPE